MAKINMSKKQSYKNIMMNIFTFVIQFVINFYISPIIVKRVGASAYGFIGLANDFVSYASVLATVFNSVASRFIANAFYQKDYQKANAYFNSLIVANWIVAGILSIAGIGVVTFLDRILMIPAELVFDVKLTFALIFGSYIISLVTLVFTVSTFVTNRTDIQGIRNSIQYMIRFALIVILLNFVSVHIYWIALATLIAGIVVAIMNMNLTRRLTPELRFGLGYARFEYALELAKAGSWMTLISISTILLRGLDLTVANVLIGDYEMGLLSVARTIPNNVTSIIATLAPIFTPVFIAAYAGDHMSELVNGVKKSIDIMALILFVPISGFIVFSYDFYMLWQSSLKEEELVMVTVLSTITVIQAYFNSTTATMAQLSVVTNKLRMPVLINLACGVISVITEVLLIKYGGMKLYAIVIPTTVVMVLRYVIFNSFYAAWCIGQSPKCFLMAVVKKWLIIPVLLILMYVIRKLLPISSWVGLCRNAVIGGGFGYALMFVVYGQDVLKDVYKKGKKG